MTNVISEIKRRWDSQKQFAHGMQTGVVSNKFTKVRHFYLSTQLFEAYYEVLSYEIGESWHFVMQKCGHNWGLSVFDEIMAEISSVDGFDINKFSINEFFKYMNFYFRSNGLGMIFFDDEYALDGIMFATIRNGFSYAALRHKGEFKDSLTSGLLEGLFCRLTEQDICCTQINQGNKSSSDVIFVLSGKERLNAVEERVSGLAKISEVATLLKNAS